MGEFGSLGVWTIALMLGMAQSQSFKLSLEKLSSKLPYSYTPKLLNMSMHLMAFHMDG